MKKPNLKRIILITGGARSGKSEMALKLASVYEEKYFVATATADDDEMKDRIEKHRASRGSEWIVIEEPLRVDQVIDRESTETNVILLDCVTLLLSNLLGAHGKDGLDDRVHCLCESLNNARGCVIAVTNEVGMGIVPADSDTRFFRDKQGFFNKQLAAIADEVYLTCCGLPLRLK